MRIAGEKIVLRDWCRVDLPLWRVWQEPQHAWLRTDGPYYPCLSDEEIETRIALLRTCIDNDRWPIPRKRLVIADRAEDGMLGTVGRYWQIESTHWLSIGIDIYDPARWRQGIGFEALGLWMDYLFRALPEAVRLDLRTWSGNTGMIRLAGKLGYVEEARFRRAVVVDGQHHDALGFGILREEWESRYPQGFRPGAMSSP